MFDREALIKAGVRPVLYLSDEEMALTRDLPDKVRNRRVRYEPGRADWLHEREWRLCFETDDKADLNLAKGLVVGVIVGEQGWLPPAARRRMSMKGGKISIEVTRFAGAADGLKRLWWNGKKLVEDGIFDIGEQMMIDAAYGQR
ncbi:hypothetical protein [Kitasatospora purpeofusca]|uniref:hypothetical protein n=1 Tax=Kitasatospora purpeofusca TaxID=67352 RepID=UPI0036B62454